MHYPVENMSVYKYASFFIHLFFVEKQPNLRAVVSETIDYRLNFLQPNKEI